ncbi:MAG TPA: efflux RND transporter periplasmic adaptor subunit [Candidatus Krumholzibacteria bacterium]|nr:efflux RND transporter periplasmic adaptor subunit [Candidatus Krumholzibacteria bacterium]
MRRASLFAANILLITTLVACDGGDEQAGGPSGGGGPGGGGEAPPMPVETATVEAAGMADEFTVVGNLDAEFEIAVVTEIAARVVALPFAEGEAVERGDLLARLDDAQIRAEVQRAEALVQQRRTNYERVRTVVSEQAGAPQDLDDAAAALAVAEADLALVRARLDKTRITAPFDGVVGARQVSPGAYLRPGDTITQLAQIDSLRVTFSAPELYLGRLGPGSPVRVRTSPFPDLVVTGSVDVIAPVLERTSRSAELVARVGNPEQKLRPGMSAEVTVILEQRPGALTIPAESVFFQGQQAFVYTIGDDDTVSMTPIELGTRSAARVEVVSGLDAGQAVVRAGHQKLFPGARVMPVGGGDEEAGA